LRKWEGKTLEEIGKAMGKDPRDAAMDLVIADRAEASVIISIMREDDVRAALAHPMISIGTDSGARAEDGPLSISKSHPRAWGSFTKISAPSRRRSEDASVARRARPRAASTVACFAGLQAGITIFDQPPCETARPSPIESLLRGIRHVLVNSQAVVRTGCRRDRDRWCGDGLRQ
jgi:N-acyl-D-aspartate/D-glutamate deacylase